MSVPKLDGNTELIIAQHILRDLEEYLNSDALYWHVAEPNPLGRPYAAADDRRAVGSGGSSRGRRR